MTTTPSPVEPVVCGCCRSRPAFVTIGSVDYCPRCAPPWHPSLLPLDDEAVAHAVDQLERELAEVAR